MAVVTAGALHGLLESLDPLSGYLSPREYADYRDRTKNALHGETGMTISKRFGYIVVVSVVPMLKLLQLMNVLAEPVVMVSEPAPPVMLADPGA